MNRRHPMPSTSAGSQAKPRQRCSRGFAVLALVSMLALLSAWAGLTSMAAAITEARGAAWQARETESLAAAETGLAWMLARLNEAHAHGDACEALPPVDADGRRRTSLLERLLAPDPPGPGPSGVTLVPLTPAAAPVSCIRDGLDWRCDCGGSLPAPAGATVGVPAGAPSTDVVPAFRVGVTAVTAADGRPVTRLVSWGCVRTDGDCSRPARAGELPARRVQVDLAVVPALAATPSGVWTATGDVSLAPSTVARNDGPATAGLVVHAGGRVDRTGARVVGQSGAPPWDAIAAHDGWLAGHDPEALAARLLGSAPASFAALSRVVSIACRDVASGCARPVATALAAGAQALRIDGPWEPGPGVEVGRPDRPVLVVVDGPVRIRGPATVHGLVVAHELEVDGRTGAIRWEGAGVAAGRLDVHGAVEADRQASVMSALASLPAAVLPAPGSWREVVGTAP